MVVRIEVNELTEAMATLRHRGRAADRGHAQRRRESRGDSSAEEPAIANGWVEP